MPMRIGQGIDVHVWGQGRPLILGGVNIPYPKGLRGHSDADVATHAVCDAILGAAGLGDIGVHFPDDDPRYEGIDSLKLLERCVEAAEEAGWLIENVDVTIIAERPKVQPHTEAMRAVLRPLLKATGGAGAVNIKATTTEGVGFIGRGEGIAAMAVALLVRD